MVAFGCVKTHTPFGGPGFQEMKVFLQGLLVGVHSKLISRMHVDVNFLNLVECSNKVQNNTQILKYKC